MPPIHDSDTPPPDRPRGVEWVGLLRGAGAAVLTGTILLAVVSSLLGAPSLYRAFWGAEVSGLLCISPFVGAALLLVAEIVERRR